MTLILGLRSAAGTVLAADSQRTEGSLRKSARKLFVAPTGIIWGITGSFAVQQELYGVLRDLSLPRNPEWREARAALARALPEASRRATAAMKDPDPVAMSAEGLFAWYSETDGRDFLLKVFSSGHAEFEPQYGAVAAPGPRQLAEFALSRSEHLELQTLPLEAAKMLAFNVADDVIRATASGVSLPLQIASVTRDGAAVAGKDELRGLEDTVAAFREHQGDFLRRDRRRAARRDTGLRP